MSFEEKLNFVLDCYKQVYNLDEGYLNIIKNNITLRRNHYRNVNISFNDENLYIKNPMGSGDFFINRFINNVRNLKYNNIYNPNLLYKEDYDVENQYLYLTYNRQQKEIITNKLRNRLDEVDESLTNTTINKMVCHEFGHLLQTNFSGNVGKNDKNHNKLVQMLCDKHPETFTIPTSKEELNIIQNGVIPIVKNDEYKNMRDYYSKKVNIVLLDDIFNEDESLLLNHINTQQKFDLGKKCFKYIYNFETTDYKICSYARLMKLVLGSNKTFRIMYKDNFELFDFFDKFEDLSTDIFKNGIGSKKPVVSCILEALENVKYNNSLYDALKLDHFFSLCLEKRVKFILKQNVKAEDVKEIKKVVDEFFNLTTKCSNDILNHEIVKNRIERRINRF